MKFSQIKFPLNNKTKFFKKIIRNDMSSIKAKVRVAVYVLVTFVILGLIEIISLSVYAVHHIAYRGESFSKYKEKILIQYSKIYKLESKTSSGVFDPVTQAQFPSHFRASPVFTTNEFGFLDNGASSPLANMFPEKNTKILRVIMLGGSSMFGTGVDQKSKTISANLERLINSNSATILKNKEYVQVLNFGQPGAHTSTSLAKLSQFLIHLEPDLIVSFDGFNDSWYALFEHKRQTGNFLHGIINWADYSYFYYNLMTGGNVSLSISNFRAIAYFLPTTTSLALSVYRKLKNGENNLFKKIVDYPPYKISSFIKERDGDFAAALLANYSAMGGLSCTKGVAFLGILQPYALENYQYLTKSEKEKIDFWESGYGKFTGGRSGYAEQMNKLYGNYESGIADLNSKFSHCSNIRFVSFRDLFSVTRINDFFVDIIHYTEEGNQRLAQKMLPIIESLLSD